MLEWEFWEGKVKVQLLQVTSTLGNSNIWTDSYYTMEGGFT